MKKNVAAETQVPSSTLKSIKVVDLIPSPLNVRANDDSNIDSLVASIRHFGRCLQNLIVIASEEHPGKWEVVGGGRRRRSLARLVAEGTFSTDHEQHCFVIDRADAKLASAIENIERVNMDPATECEAFRDLLENEGKSIDAIADAFGTTPLIVERRLALTKASPKLFAKLRTKDITTEQLRALCATNDHARQEQVWERAHQKTPEALRRAVIGERIDASTDARVIFIGGTAAFKAAGGIVHGDLFSDATDAGFIDDTQLLDKLVNDHLTAIADGLRAEGWSWVEVQPEYNNNNYRLGTIRGEVVLSDDDKATLAVLENEIESLGEEQDAMNSDDDSQEANERYEALDDRISMLHEKCSAIRDAAQQFTAKAKAKAGVIVSINEDGTPCIERGRVKAEDRKAAVVAAGSEVQGGRETKAAGRKEGISDALTQSLLAHRNIAAQSELAAHVQVAKVLQAVWSVNTIRHDHYRLPVDLHINAMAWGIRRNTATSKDETVSARAKAFEKIGTALVKDLPTDWNKLWDALCAYSNEQLDALNAYAFAMSLSLGDDHKGITGKLLDAIDFNMAQHFEPTVENYLGRQVPKAMIVKALAEVGKAGDKQTLLAMKNRDLATEAQTRLAGTGYVPDLIRTPRAKVVKAKPGEAGKNTTVAAKKAPAKTKAQPKAPAKGKAKTKKAA